MVTNSFRPTKTFYHIVKRARKYNKLVEIWQTAPNVTSFGDRYVSDTLLTKTWANIKTSNSLSRSTEFGITDTNDTIILTLRKRNDLNYNSLNQFFKYRGYKWIIQGTPINVGFEDNEIQITLKRQSIKDANIIPPILVDVFDFTFDNTFN